MLRCASRFFPGFSLVSDHTRQVRKPLSADSPHKARLRRFSFPAIGTAAGLLSAFAGAQVAPPTYVGVTSTPQTVTVTITTAGTSASTALAASGRSCVHDEDDALRASDREADRHPIQGQGYRWRLEVGAIPRSATLRSIGGNRSLVWIGRGSEPTLARGRGECCEVIAFKDAMLQSSLS